jgi:ubiquinone/menaquinone biosynthesis C-methylase UbiE
MQQSHQSQIRDEFTRQADAMVASAVFTDQEILARIRHAAGLTPRARVLDLACGPGIVTAALAPYAGAVTALDLTPAMVTRARQRSRNNGFSNVHCALGLAEALPFADETFDVIVNRSALHHFPHPDAALSEMARVLRPSGRLVISDVVSSEVAEESTLHNALEVLRDPSHVRMLPRGELLGILQGLGLHEVSSLTWTHHRGFDEWLHITNAPERIAPLRAVMTALAQSKQHAGINLHLDGEDVVFEHRTLLLAMEKQPGSV